MKWLESGCGAAFFLFLHRKSYETKSPLGRIALLRRGNMSLKRSAAGGESCGVRFFYNTRESEEAYMGGFFGVASQQDCVFDLFLGSIITPAWEPGGLVRGQGQVWQNPRWSLGKKQTPSACPLRTSPSTI